ncbi:hypothetical protein NA57DRAFT_52307 [Rhizodiscina lignyota]|uniref:Uncharacterized protein n=1 Tax=Rhizodiscina lignyota TaxID=1504668 RepID=A0A9P4INI4_9PEZI|nr:hypothetical protein NA57DRAFT_52307 [Rhizodiscina lignyota]
MVTQADAPSPSPPRHAARNSLTTAAAIRRGEIKISNPIPISDAHDGDVPGPASLSAVPAAEIVVSADDGSQEPAALTDIRPPQPPQFHGLYDGRPPTRRRVVPNGNGGVTTITTGDPAAHHSRALKSVEVLPTQSSLVPRTQYNRSSLRAKRASPSENKRNSGVMSGNSVRGSYEASGDEDIKDSPKDKKRGSGTLRAVLRKMFGGSGSKKEKDDRTPSRKGSRAREIGDWMVNQDSEQDALTRSNTTHNISQFASERKPPIDPMKLPVHDITTRTPLGSHLPFPMNVNAPEPSPPRASDHHPYLPQTFEPSGTDGKVPRRRATLPSLILSPTDIAALGAIWDKEIEGGAVDEELRKKNTPTPDIGMAITSASGYSSRRRSRSADALNVIAKEHEIMQQQPGVEEAKASGRQAEIEYWRASLTAGVQTHDFEPLREEPREEPREESLKRQETTESSMGSGTSMKTAHIAQSEDEHGHADVDEDDEDSLMQRRTPPNERASFEKPSPEDVRPPHSFDRPFTDDRNTLVVHGSLLGHSRNFSRPVADVVEVEKMRESLEDRICKLEQLVYKLENSSNRRTIILENAPKGRRENGEENSSGGSYYSKDQRPRHASHMQSTTEFIPQNQDSPSGDPSSPLTPTLPSHSQQPFHSYSASPLPSNSMNSQMYQHQNPVPTVGSYDYAASSSNPGPSSLPSPNIYDHLAPLYAALRYERSKRKEFAAQMHHVHQQLGELNTIVRGSANFQYNPLNPHCYGEVKARGPTGLYPTPSPEDVFGSQGSMTFNNADDEAMIAQGQQSRFSGLDYDSSEDEDDGHDHRRRGRAREPEGADTESGAEKEIYATPKETSLSPQQSREKNSPPVPPAPTTPKQSKLPTPKQSMKSLVQKKPSVSSITKSGSSSTVGTGGSKGSHRNRFGFLGGKG